MQYSAIALQSFPRFSHTHINTDLHPYHHNKVLSLGSSCFGAHRQAKCQDYLLGQNVKKLSSWAFKRDHLLYLTHSYDQDRKTSPLPPPPHIDTSPVGKTSCPTMGSDLLPSLLSVLSCIIGSLGRQYHYSLQPIQTMNKRNYSTKGTSICSNHDMVESTATHQHILFEITIQYIPLNQKTIQKIQCNIISMSLSNTLTAKVSSFILIPIYPEK